MLGRFAFVRKDTRCLARIAVVAVTVAALGLGLAACGGGTSDEAIARAEKRGRHYKMEQERKRRIEKELKELRKRQKQLDHSTAPNTVPVPVESTPSTPAPSGGIASCGNELSVGPDTTCPFAENVRYAYESEIGSGSGNVSAYSPANDEVYNMYCTSAPHECSGAISATVYFP